jgi:hypothetical protein
MSDGSKCLAAVVALTKSFALRNVSRGDHGQSSLSTCTRDFSMDCFAPCPTTAFSTVKRAVNKRMVGVNRDSIEAAYSCVFLLLCEMAVEMTITSLRNRSIPHTFATYHSSPSASTVKRAINNSMVAHGDYWISIDYSAYLCR